MSSSPAQQTPPKIFDRQRIAARMARFKSDRIDFVTELVITDLADRLAPITRQFSKALIMGPDARFLPQKMQSASGPIKFARAATLSNWDGLMLDPEKFLPPPQ